MVCVVRFVACAALVVACSCAKTEPPIARPLTVEIGGCVRVVEPSTCITPGAGVLRLWVAGAHARLHVLADGQPLAIESPRAVQDGVAFGARVPAASRKIEVRAVDADGGAGEWSFALSGDDAPAWLHEATSLKRDGKLEDAEARLTDGAPYDARGAAWSTGLRARIALRRNDVDLAAALFRQAIALDRAAGLSSNAGDDAVALAFVLSFRLHDTRAAQEALSANHAAFATYSEGTTDELYSRATVTYAAGDWRAALRLLNETIASAERLDLTETARSARATIALQLEYLGRWREALATLDAIAASDTPDVPPCSHASALVDIGEGRLLAQEAGTTETALDPLPPLVEAIAIHRASCGDTYERALALANAAQASVRHGDVGGAQRYLDEARLLVPSPEPYLEASFDDALGRIRMAENRRAAARDAFRREARIGDDPVFPIERWRGSVGLGEALEAMGLRERAVDAYVAAEQSLDEAIVRVPLGEGRATFIADREASARNLVDLLLRIGRPREALRRAREASGRVITVLVGAAESDALPADVRERWRAAVDDYRRARESIAREASLDWQQPSDALERARAARRVQDARARAALDEVLASVTHVSTRAPTYAAPSQGQLLLAYFPVRKGWAAFAATPERVRAVRFELPPSGASKEALAASLLAPFSAEIAGATELLVLPHGATQAIDFHALPFAGAPLNAALPVRYVIDLRDASTSEGAGALVVSDPTSDLEAARAEGAGVRAALEAAHVSVRALTGTAITPAELARVLPEASLAHFAGHGVYEGRDGWDSALLLGGGARFGVGDVLALRAAPARIVLTACEAARTSDPSAQGLGLGQAFLIAGAREVVAPVRPVGDDVARALADALYASLVKGGSLVTALRDAQEAVRAADPAADWAAFRAIARSEGRGPSPR